MTQKIDIREWAAARYSAPPSDWVLGKWRRNGEIYPPPEKVGRRWFVRPDAVRQTGNDEVDFGGSLVDRLRQGVAA